MPPLNVKSISQKCVVVMGNQNLLNTKLAYQFSFRRLTAPLKRFKRFQGTILTEASILRISFNQGVLQNFHKSFLAFSAFIYHHAVKQAYHEACYISSPIIATPHSKYV
jgi:hypothetical protein